MWKKPSIEKPEFKKVNLEELSGKESLETNGGATGLSIGIIIPVIPIPFKPPIILSGFVGPAFDFSVK